MSTNVEMVRCAICGQEYPRSEMMIHSGEYVCQQCADTYFTACEDCGELCLNEELRAVTVEDEVTGRLTTRYVCNDCLHLYGQCADCGCWYGLNLLTRRNGSFYCEDCRADHRPINMHGNLVRGYHAHHGIDLPTFAADGETVNPDTLTLGAELEVDSKSRESWLESKEELAQSIIDVWDSDFVFFEDDGSLRYGFENITCPGTLAFHMANKDKYKDMFRVIRESGLRSHQTTSCGLHVHFNRSFFPVADEELCVARLLYMVEKFWDELVIFSRRSYSNLDRWAKKNNRDAFEEAKMWKEGRLDHDNRYQAVNLTNQKTIEIRIFRGTLKTNTFLATLQLVSNMATYARDKDIQYLQTMNFEELINTPELERYWEKAQERHNS